MVEYGPLVFSWIVAGLAIAWVVSFSQINAFSSMKKLCRLLVVEMGGLLTSAWTLMITISWPQVHPICAADGIVQCGSVIGDLNYSTDPILGLLGVLSV